MQLDKFFQIFRMPKDADMFTVCTEKDGSIIFELIL